MSYDMLKKKCDNCPEIIEYFGFMITPPPLCRGCQREAGGKSRDIWGKRSPNKKKPVEIAVEIHLPKPFEYKSKFEDDSDTIFFKRIPRVSQRLQAKYRDIQKVTGILRKRLDS